MEHRLARALGLSSLGLGITALAAPRAFAATIGVKPNERRERIARVFGARELLQGAGLLTRQRPTGFVWSRVIGDLVDLTVVGRAFTAKDVNRQQLQRTFNALLGTTGVDLYTAVRMTAGAGQRRAMRGREAEARRGVTVTNAVTVDKPRDEVYRFWRDFKNLPRFMVNVEDVAPRGEGRTHWKGKGPFGRTVEWDAEIVEDRPNELLAWRTIGGGVGNAGTVRFEPAPGDRGTEVTVELEYQPPGGPVGATVAKLLSPVPSEMNAQNLRRFKQVMETGEVVRSEATVSGPSIRQRPAQPPGDGQ
jgi:uncharacterized membrane protein